MFQRSYYKFGEYLLDQHSGALYRGSELVRLEPKMADLLLFMIERRGLVLSKDELLTGVWGKAAVEGSAIRRNISVIRAALDADNPERFIRTHPRQGYSFVADASAESNISQPPNSGEKFFEQFFKSKISYVVIGAALVLLVAISIWQIHRHSQAQASKTEFIATQLTSNTPELPILAAAISPDGNRVAYADDAQLYVSNRNMVDRKSLTLPKNTVVNYIDWFSDGMHLLISGVDRDSRLQSIWNIPILDGQPQRLVIDARMASTSPDGKHILYVNDIDQLWIADNDGLNATELVVLKKNEGIGARPKFSPDGAYVLQARLSDDHSWTFIEAVEIATHKTTLLYKTEYYVDDFAMRGAHALIVSQEHSAAVEVIDVQVDLSKGANSEPKVIMQSNDYTTWTLNASKSGNDILVVNNRSSISVYVADMSHDGHMLLNPRRLTHNDYSNRPSSWLSDNKTILFYSNRAGRYDIYSQSIDEPDARELVVDPHEKYWPVVTADNKWLFYFIDDHDLHHVEAESTLVRKSLVNGQQEIIDSNLDSYRTVRCAVRADVCVIAEHESDQGIFYTFDPTKGKGKVLSRVKWAPSLNYCYWDISPDGRRIAYIDTADDVDGIAVISLDARDLTVKHVHVSNQDPLRTLIWDAAGKGFYASVVHSSGDMLKLLHIDMNGVAETMRWQVNSLDGRAVPSPDGRHIAYQQTVINSNIWLLQKNQH